MALCKSTFMYKFGRSEEGIKAGVGAQKTVNVKVKVSLLLIKLLSASLFLPARAKLWQVRGSAI